MKRRSFVKNISTVATALAFAPALATSRKSPKPSKVGVQLFSLPKLLEKDFNAGIQMISEIGYKEIEMYGPFPFSVDAIKERWNTITPNLGFSGSGYFGHSPQEVKKILDHHGIKVTAAHADMDTMQTRMEQIGEAGDQLGFEYIGLPSIPEAKRQTLDDYKRVAEEFNEIGEKAKKVGLKFAYHNHGYGLQKVAGQIPLDLIFEETDPDLVFFEMDIYWTIAGGADPIAYLTAYPDRYRLMHIKDMKEKVRFSGDGGEPSQWIALFPYMTALGEGVLDIPSIISFAREKGVKHFYVEQDMAANPESELKKSFDYLKTVGLLR
ncbi:sugar phosphate isomerase/epimerase family protein [Maribacter chungangensis]|uniref:Sugar phosphate isomerase/epimerase family protein n=1 Tax=Maribacter chungangensis TaxID=1069117 RepID=A0ABW3B7K4_9FLAO